MGERKGYLNTDELQADDQLSPRPSSGNTDGHRTIEDDNAALDGAGEAQHIPRPATSE